jgi:hypothetical protein
MKGELEAIMNTIEATTYKELQTIDQLIDYGFVMVGWIARTGEIMAAAKEDLHKKRRQAYINAVASLGSQEKKIGALLIKDYINDCCAEENALYELAERCNRAATHCNDLIRTAISALKQEKYTLERA